MRREQVELVPPRMAMQIPPIRGCPPGPETATPREAASRTCRTWSWHAACSPSGRHLRLTAAV